MTLVQIILIAVILVIIMGAVALFMMNQEAERKKRALNIIQGQAGSTSQVSDKEVQNKRREEISKKLKESKAEENKKNKKKASISLLLEQAGMEASTKKYWTIAAIVMVVFVLAAKLMGHGPFVMLMAAIIGLLGAPRMFLKRKAAKRQKKFLEEFPDALEATVRLLKAGMPVSEAVLMISREFTGPVGEEMSMIYEKQKIGVALHEAANEATKRMPLAEMKMFATGLAIQAQTGSSLSEVLMNLAGVIRGRFRLKRKIKALSSEAIASASIIGALPNFVALGLYFANREYLMILFTDPFGKVLLAGAVIWMMIGILIMRAMINFKI